MISLLPRLFTASHLQELAWYGFSDLLETVRPFLRSASSPDGPATTADLLEAAFSHMRREYPVEYVYKACVLKRLLFGTHSPRTAALYVEFPIAEARADMLLVNGEATVFEVKSRFDSISRLDAQLLQYYECFTLVTLLAEEAEADEYLDSLPSHVGVVSLTPRFSLSVKRTPTPYADDLRHESLFRILQQREKHAVADGLGLDVSTIDPSDRYHAMLDRFATLPVEEAHAQVVATLHCRQSTESLATLCHRLPESLHAAVFSYRLRRKDWDALFDLLHRPPGEDN